MSDVSSTGDDAGATDVSSLYVGTHLQYDRRKWDRAFLYRSVRTEDAGGTLTASVMHLEKIISLDDYELIPDTTLYPLWKIDQDIRNAIYWFELEDKQLIFQDPYLDQTLFDKTMPFGGASALYDGTLFVSNITGTPETVDNSTSELYRNVGEIRWSSLAERSPELFPVSNYYLPEDGNSDIIAFEKAASNMIAFSKDRIYHMRRVTSGVGGFVKINEIHKGFGIVNPKASTSVGNTVYFLSSKGLKTIDSTGRMDDVKSIDQLIVEDWKNDLDVCEVHYDSVVSCIYILNPRAEEMVCFWFNTGKITMMHDVPFTTGGEGFFPVNRGSTSSATNFDGELEKRVMFLQNIKVKNSDNLTENYPILGSTVTTAAHKWSPKIWIYDHKKENTQNRLLVTDSAASRADNIQVGGVIRTDSETNGRQKYFLEVGTSGGSLYFTQSDLYKYLYVTNNTEANSPYAGLKYILLNIEDNKDIGGSTVNGKQRITVHPEGHNTNINPGTATDPSNNGSIAKSTSDNSAGDFIVLSPIPFEYVGHPLVDISADGVTNPMDFHSVKYVDSIGIAISDISNTSIDYKVMRSEVGLYEGNNETALVSSQPVKTNGTADSGFANNLGSGTFISLGDSTGTQSTSLIPFFKAKVIGATFRLISILVSGKILGTYNRNHPGV